MYHLLRRHPLPITAHFKNCLVLTFAVPEALAATLIPDGLSLDTHNGSAFVAAAFVQTTSLRPALLPACCGQDFFLAGYRVFVKRRTNEGRTLRGLRILRSDANRRAMVWGGNLLTHYDYHLCRAECQVTANELTVRVTSPDGRSDVDLSARLGGVPAGLPSGSPFENARAARRFAGPLPYTFDYEPETHSIIRIKGVRQAWNPMPCSVDVRRIEFLHSGSFAGCRPVLAAAFHVAGVPYRWNRGVVERIAEVAA